MHIRTHPHTHTHTHLNVLDQVSSTVGDLLSHLHKMFLGDRIAGLARSLFASIALQAGVFGYYSGRGQHLLLCAGHVQQRLACCGNGLVAPCKLCLVHKAWYGSTAAGVRDAHEVSSLCCCLCSAHTWQRLYSPRPCPTHQCSPPWRAW